MRLVSTLLRFESYDIAPGHYSDSTAPGQYSVTL